MYLFYAYFHILAVNKLIVKILKYSFFVVSNELQNKLIDITI